jgi:hypothetical protein
MHRLRLGGAILVLVLLGAATAQDDKEPVKVRGQLPQYYKKLGLRDDQVQQIYKLRAGFKAKVENLKRQLEKLKAEEKESLEKMLTAEQLKRLRQLRSGETTPEKPKDKATEKAKSKEKEKPNG